MFPAFGGPGTAYQRNRYGSHNEYGHNTSQSVQARSLPFPSSIRADLSAANVCIHSLSPLVMDVTYFNFEFLDFLGPGSLIIEFYPIRAPGDYPAEATNHALEVVLGQF